MGGKAAEKYMREIKFLCGNLPLNVADLTHLPMMH